MKLFILLSIAALAAARPEDYSKYEEFNVQELVGNKRLLQAYALCFLDEGKCTSEGNDFKKWIPDAIQSNCGACSDHQKKLVATMIKAIDDQLPEEMKRLHAKYNPDKKYDTALKDFLDKYSQ